MKQILRHTFSISFYCRESKVNKMGLAPIEVSIIVNGERVMLTLPRKESPAVFERQRQSKRNNELKVYLSKIYTDISNATNTLQMDSLDITAQSIKDRYLGNNVKTYSVGDICKDYMKYIDTKLKNNEISFDTLLKYINARKFMESVIDMSMAADDVDFEVSERLYSELKSRYKISTANHYLNRIKTMFLYAMKRNKIKTNPFVELSIQKVKHDITTINDSEYMRILNHEFSNARLNKVRLLFLLSCNCGLAFTDLINLKREDFTFDDDGNVVIDKTRIKTDVEYISFMLPDGVKILKSIDYDMSVLKISNQKCNAYLKEIGDICGISIDLHHHLARHFYITRLVRMGVNLTTVQKCAGHASYSMTLRYTHLHHNDIISEVSSKL